MGRKIGSQSNAIFSTPPASASPRWDQLGSFASGQFLSQDANGSLVWASPTSSGGGGWTQLDTWTSLSSASPRSINIDFTSAGYRSYKVVYAGYLFGSNTSSNGWTPGIRFNNDSTAQQFSNNNPKGYGRIAQSGTDFRWFAAYRNNLNQNFPGPNIIAGAGMWQTGEIEITGPMTSYTISGTSYYSVHVSGTGALTSAGTGWDTGSTFNQIGNAYILGSYTSDSAITSVQLSHIMPLFTQTVNGVWYFYGIK